MNNDEKLSIVDCQLSIVLFEPLIPQNTGNIVRTCKATGTTLHLVEPLGFQIDDKKLKRAGLDYWHDMDIRIYENWADFTEKNPGARLWFVETFGEKLYTQVSYSPGDYLVFGKETTGIPREICATGECIYIPMVKDNRSLNLSNCAAIVLYEAIRQCGGSAPTPPFGIF